MPSTRVRSRSRSTIARVASTPTSAVIRLSSISSQASSSRWSRESRPSRPLPKAFCERASRARSRTSRPAVGSGRSSSGPARASTSGGSTGRPVDSGGSSAGLRTAARPAAARAWSSSPGCGGGGSSRRRIRGTTSPRPRPPARRAGPVRRRRIPCRNPDRWPPRAWRRPGTWRLPVRSVRRMGRTLRTRPWRIAPCAHPAVPPVTAHLLIGPLLRRVVDNRATVWVETSAPALVTVRGRRRRAGTAPTFSAYDHHYALVVVDGLTPDRATATRCCSTTRRSGRCRDGFPAQRDPHQGRRRPRPAGPPDLRLLPGDHPAHTTRKLPPDALDAYARRLMAAPRTSARPTCWCCSATRSMPTRPRRRSGGC